MVSVIVAHAWRSFPFYAISFLAGMQTIPQELYDAAQVDGASRWQQFRHITLPGLYHIIGVVLLLTTIQTANAFEPVYLLTGGGPSDATMVYTMLVYVMGMVNLRLGEAAAVSTLFLPLLVGLVLVVTGLLQRRRPTRREAQPCVTLSEQVANLRLAGALRHHGGGAAVLDGDHGAQDEQGALRGLQLLSRAGRRSSTSSASSSAKIC